MKYIKIHEFDNVVVTVEDMKHNEVININGKEIPLREDVMKGHKIATTDLKKGDKVIKYGYEIGSVIEDVSAGGWLHFHNLKTNLSDKISYTYSPKEINNKLNVNVPTFLGYKRKDGRVATRNEIWIINTVGCVNTSAERIAKISNEKFQRENFDGVFSFSHPYGCSQLGDDLDDTKKILAGLAKNPNAGGILILGLGCENNQLKYLLEEVGESKAGRIEHFNSQEVIDEIEEGVSRIEKIFNAMKEDKREEVPISELVLGVKCGGSDGFSGITANPLTGKITDKLTSFGGSVLQTEVPEMFGAEQILMNRAKDEKVYGELVQMINDFKQYYINHNQPIYENPSPGNKAGGLTTLEEKSLGAIQKGGQATVTQILKYGEQISSKGLVLLEAPGNDGVSSTAMTASGATLLIFTTGRGTPLGFPVPTIKVSTNTTLNINKPNWIDFNAGVLLDGDKTIDELSKEFLNKIIEIASGKIKTKNEINGYKEIAIWKKGVTL